MKFVLCIIKYYQKHYWLLHDYNLSISYLASQANFWEMRGRQTTWPTQCTSMEVGLITFYSRIDVLSHSVILSILCFFRFLHGTVMERVNGDKKAKKYNQPSSNLDIWIIWWLIRGLFQFFREIPEKKRKIF